MTLLDGWRAVLRRLAYGPAAPKRTRPFMSEVTYVRERSRWRPRPQGPWDRKIEREYLDDE